MRQKVIGIIPARFASTRLPGKLLLPICGKPLIEHTFENAKKCKSLDELYVATDSEKIASHIHALGGKTIMTSLGCRNGTERLIEALKKNEELQESDLVVNIQGDHPYISPLTITSCIDLLINDKSAVMSTAASPIEYEKALSSHVVKCVIDKKSNALYFSRSVIPFQKSKLDKTSFYHHIGLYVYRTSFLLYLNELENTPLQEEEDLEQLKILEHGYNIKVAIVKEIELGVDTPEDITKVEKYLCLSNTYL